MPNTDDANRDRNARQDGAGLEGEIPDADDTIRDRDARQATAINEGPKFNASNRLTFDDFWNYQISCCIFSAISNNDGITSCIVR